MTTQISINVVEGNSQVSEDDCYRAEAAALKVLSAAGLTVDEAYSEFKRQWNELDSYDGMTGAAAAWVNAENAADLALTEGWTDPDGAHCCISA